jgi:transcription elongation factor GreA
MGRRGRRYAGATPWNAAAVESILMPMAEHRSPMSPAARPSQRPTAGTGLVLSEAEYAALVDELEFKRGRHRTELARRLRDAREFGAPAENDDLLAVLEDAAVDQARLAQLEEVVRSASVAAASDAIEGVAGLGSVVLVQDETGGTAQYKLVGRRSSESGRHEVSLASPAGEALLGSRSGDLVRILLPNGRDRTLRVLEVRSRPNSAAASAPRLVGKAAWVRPRLAWPRNSVGSFNLCPGA